MNIQFKIFLLLILITFHTHPQEIVTAKNEITYNSVLSDFSLLIPVDKAVLPQEGISFRKDAAEFQLNEGELVRMSSIAGRKAVYLFKGKGLFVYNPNTNVEKEHLYRFYESDNLKSEFDKLFIISADSDFSKVFDNLTFSEIDNSDEYKSNIKNSSAYIINKESGYCDKDIIIPFIEEESNDFFYTHIETESYGPLFYEINPYENEEIKLMRKIDGGFLIDRKVKEIINQFHSSDKNYSKVPKFENSFQVSFYRIDLQIDDGLEIKAKCIEVIKRNIPERNWIKLYLYEDLNVDSIKINDENKVIYHRGKDNPELWIKLPGDSNLDKEYSVTIYYSGDVLTKNEYGWIGLQSSIGWYPILFENELSIFDVTFTYPEKYTMISVGNEVSYEENEDYKMSRWQTEYPVAAVSFNIGVFKKFEFPDANGVDIIVYISEAGHREMARVLTNYYQIFSTSNPEEKIGNDVLASVQFYNKMFGKIPIKKLHVTEIPYSHGQAFPGMVHLSWYNYQGTQYDGSDEQFRAHEVAHQWWGHGVRFKSYHDQWLDEGFAEYSALMFVQAAFNDNDMFFGLLNNWKDEIFNNRVYLFSKGQEAGPIWLGQRTSTSSTKGDYNLIIYKKGAWVLHMLRNMLLDLQTMNEDLFNNMMKDYFKSFSGKKTSTEDFKKIVSKHFGEDMSWFFNQFVYGTEIPTYRFSYKSEEMENGKYKVTCKVILEDVSDNFKMYVPMKIEFGSDRFARIRKEINQRISVFDLPLLPEEPEELIFNDLESVLCKVKYESWSD